MQTEKLNKTMAITLAVFLLAVAVPMAYAETIGNATVETTTAQANTGEESVSLSLIDGTEDIAALSFDVDMPLSNITSLTFSQRLVNDTAPFGANIILGIDANDNGDYDADDLAWHIGAPHDPNALAGDTFIEMDGVAVGDAWDQVDALSVTQWWTPNETGDGFDACYTSFTDLLADCTGTGHAVENATEVNVKVIRLLIGGSSSWSNMTIFIDDVTLNGENLMAEPEPEPEPEPEEEFQARSSGPPSKKGLGIGYVFSCFFYGDNCDQIATLEPNVIEWLLNSNAVENNPEVKVLLE